MCDLHIIQAIIDVFFTNGDILLYKSFQIPVKLRSRKMSAVLSNY